MTKENILITGANGQLGTELSKILPNAILTDYQDLDITKFDSVQNFVEKYHVDTIVNCAAYTAVDDAEDNYGEACKINALGPKNLAKTSCRIIHVSTDYVFNGNKVTPYFTTDLPNPLSVYGETKWFGEMNVARNSKNYVIIRTSWLYSPYGKNFVKTMRKLGATREEITVVDDQYGFPTYAADLAGAIVQIIPQKKSGIYHYQSTGKDTNENFNGISWFDFATEIMKQSKLDCCVKPITTSEYPTRAVRPSYSVLDTSRTQQIFGVKIPLWKDALQRCIKEIERQ
ncbi:MAG: dTDP-4-dehydrorhamnose reductase [Alphaproteobacteria bacterium]|nr:dTDP-4-dehydrorhamnose reductase [Alphaproteobacteria bacterium]